jgi:Fe-S-cluster containining protein
MIDKTALAAGLELLHRPVLPLVTIVQFFLVTGDFDSVEEVIGQLPEDIETGYAVYAHAAADLAPYTDLLQPLIDLKAGRVPEERVVTSDGESLDAMSAISALVAQQVLTRELEQINSLLCAPCNCTLCCIGPDTSMEQDFFEIPLQSGEAEFFPLERIDTEASRAHRADEEPSLQVGGRNFYQRTEPVLIHWRHGWSQILPKTSRCPNLESSGRCRVYPNRPQVCRRPQIFPYMVEPTEQNGQPVLRLRQALLGVIDCPYVQLLQEEIAAYAAACELEMIFRHNKA